MQNTNRISHSDKMMSLAKKIEGTTQFTSKNLKKILQECQVTLADLEPFSHFSHSPNDSYGRECIYDGGFFEILIVSWDPFDCSAIHDHGYTQWGVVQVLSEMEHSTFHFSGNHLETLSIHTLKSNQVISVSHELLHRMRNHSSKKTISLHIYGNKDRSSGITENSRVFNVLKKRLEYTSGGAFYHLPNSEIKNIKTSITYDFATYMQDALYYLNRLEENPNEHLSAIKEIKEQIYSKNQYDFLKKDILEVLSQHTGHTKDSNQWRLIVKSLANLSKKQKEELQNKYNEVDKFKKYAFLYDELIGVPCLENFIKPYLLFFFKKEKINVSELNCFSIGCGTGLIEECMIKELGFSYDKIYGMDISPAMVNIANKRIRANIGNVLELSASIKKWKMVFCGLNVLQYLHHDDFKKSIENIASVIEEQGYFVGDFITPDHIRWYPNLLVSQKSETLSLRTPQLIEYKNHLYQCSHIININTQSGFFESDDEGEHKRFLPSMIKVRNYFKEYFGNNVKFYDAISLKEIGEDAETSPSTRYIIIAQKS